ncbi:MAG TPA: NAD(P)H-hydrate epimerase [Ruminococcaceae bacterium]|jgi:NAD(P)H-hydrate epimerase|nr:NAD(P)H-hydrate epimerase [Oscillospiraceae bacterium]HCM24901.1 NAD(P)H-hydrate epimerase [Oscillospiraceae bacterium]
MKTVTVSQMKQIEKNAMQNGLTSTKMMENAGSKAAEFLLQKQPSIHSAMIFAGKGNNGGDGFVAARLLKKAGCDVVVVLTDGMPQTKDACLNFERLKLMAIPVFDFSEDTEPVTLQIPCVSVLIDAIFGTGFHGILPQNMRLVTSLMNRCGRPVCSLDIPSGVCADTGEFSPDTVQASWTIAFDSLKYAHVGGPGIFLCGETIPADIGIPEKCHEILE